MNMPFYNIPSFPFFSSSFYLFLIDFFPSFFHFSKRNEINERIKTFQLHSLLFKVHRWRWPIYFPRISLYPRRISLEFNYACVKDDKRLIIKRRSFVKSRPNECIYRASLTHYSIAEKKEKEKKKEEKPFKRVKAECENSNWSMAAKNCAAKIGRKRRLVGKRTRGRFLLLSGPREAGKFNWAASERFSSEVASWRPTFKSFADARPANRRGF